MYYCETEIAQINYSWWNNYSEENLKGWILYLKPSIETKLLDDTGILKESRKTELKNDVNFEK